MCPGVSARGHVSGSVCKGSCVWECLQGVTCLGVCKGSCVWELSVSVESPATPTPTPPFHPTILPHPKQPEPYTQRPRHFPFPLSGVSTPTPTPPSIDSWGRKERKLWALRPQKPLRLTRDGEVGGSGIIYLTPTRCTVTTRMILH